MKSRNCTCTLLEVNAIIKVVSAFTASRLNVKNCSLTCTCTCMWLYRVLTHFCKNSVIVTSVCCELLCIIPVQFFVYNNQCSCTDFLRILIFPVSQHLSTCLLGFCDCLCTIASVHALIFQNACYHFFQHISTSL